MRPAVQTGKPLNMIHLNITTHITEKASTHIPNKIINTIPFASPPFAGPINKTHIRLIGLTLYIIETPFDTFANRADPEQAA